ncbi:cell division site-positioning protein MapZ family protein [Lactococcus formosensis]|uniref:Cell division site-positioning protein MapZ family protein n=1 Tax=Lactococcus formosensis TaxID=1281486 RepID=A0A9X4SMZ8_9LACT|nr:cell division site-positioning protein MapZ family protein [Lactococcus formosensis]MDG6142288.1 cell division site-positioning protein MapZ family protein [Lactococcus formosensis]MDG6155094.1 cell division site-positioning protein MapZ family protein [Lactococcus formosensis]MDG6159493.1 cell division site-positioning protein MapZ family protein [Lactococcus formosensis]MDG6165727.1 cell division site-positioning protein MapZ family protein [Lactococcus formosensis]MDG6172180.1 cell divis
MTEEKDKNIKNSGEKVLKLGDVSDFTVGEIVKKAQRVDKENSESESVLDKYIRQHRGEIEAVKNQALEKYIQTERKKMDQEEDGDSEEEVTSAEEKSAEASETQASETDSTDSTDSKEAETVAPSKESNFKEKNKSEFDEVEIADDVPPVIPVPVNLSEKESAADQAEETESQVEDFPELSNQVPASKEEVAETSPTEESVSTVDEELENSLEAEEDINGVEQEAASTDEGKLPQEETVVPLEKTPVAGETVPTPLPVTPVVESEASAQEEQPEKKKNKKPLIIGLCALILLAAGGAGYALYNYNNNEKAANQAAVESKANLNAFNKAYDEFFTDSDHQVLKNSNFDQLSALKNKLKTLKGSDFDTAETKVNALEAQIKAVEKVNALFNKSAIVDGELNKEAQVKAAVSIPAVPKTENEKLNKVLAQAINLAKTQQSEAKSKEEQAAKAAQSNDNAATQPANQTTDQAGGTSDSTEIPSGTPAQQADKNTAQGGAASSTTAVTADGAQNPTGATPDNSNARVQPQANLNPQDPAFTWKPGIRDKVLNIARQRGYISGNDFILLPVAIHTMTSGYMSGQVAGYFNLYRPDGSYLLTINNKTGYFFGNGKGLPTDFG